MIYANGYYSDDLLRREGLKGAQVRATPLDKNRYLRVRCVPRIIQLAFPPRCYVTPIVDPIPNENYSIVDNGDRGRRRRGERGGKRKDSKDKKTEKNGWLLSIF